MSLRRFRFSRLASDAGLTLVELMIVVALLGLVLAPAFMYLSSVQRGESRISNATQQDTESRLAVERLSRALREAAYPQNQTYTTSSLFDSIGGNDVKIYADANNDGVIERTRFYLSGTTLFKTVVVPDCTVTPCSYGGAPSSPTPVIENVQNGVGGKCGRAAGVTQPVFTYLSRDAGGGAPVVVNPTTDINMLVDIYEVQMTVQVQMDSVNAPACQTLNTTVLLRNHR